MAAYKGTRHPWLDKVYVKNYLVRRTVLSSEPTRT